MASTPTATNTTGVGVIDAQLSGLTSVEKLLLTLGLVGIFVAGFWLAGVLRRRVDAEGREQTVNALFTLGIATLAVLVGLSVLLVWRSELDRLDAFGFLSFQNPAAVAIRAALTVLVAVGAYAFTGSIKEFIHELTEDAEPLTKHQTELLFRSTQVALYIFAGLIALSLWDVNLGGLLVGAGFLGIVLGLAAQQTLGSLIAGFVLMFARPFEIGDWVQIGDREGTVAEVSIVNTRIQTFDGEYAMIPNDIVSSSEVINRTRKGRLRVRVEVGVDYTTDLDLAIDTATAAMRDVDEVLTTPEPQVVLTEFGSSAVVLELRFWIDEPSARRRWRAQTAVVRAVKTAFEREEIKIPFPQRELMGRVEQDGFRLSGESPVVDPSREATPDGGEE
jgi:small-conductance mechanosensitive channel